MEIKQISQNKWDFLNLLLLGDEQEDMIARYLDRGDLYALYDNGLKAVCVVTQEDKGVYEIKNLAVQPQFQRRGYGKKMISFVCSTYQDTCHTLFVGTGDSPATLPFYLKCGFKESHRIPHFFTDHYDHPVFEGGKQLIDMIYLKRKLK